MESLVAKPTFKYVPGVVAEHVDNKFGDVINEVFRWTDGETAGRYSTFYNVPAPMEFILVLVSYSGASASGTLQLEKLTGTQAPGAGSTILSTTISLAGAVNTVITRTQRQMTASRVFVQGDRIALIDGGVLTGIRDLVITIYYAPRGRGGYA
jgi:hypothetical protein